MSHYCPDKLQVVNNLNNLFSRDGQNLISTLACNHQNWPEERTFANFIEVIKNILGCSFGTVLRHSRVLEPNKEKMSPEMVAEYKAQMEQLGRLKVSISI